MTTPRPTTTRITLGARSPAQERAVAMLACWDRIGIGIRCGYNPFCPCPVRQYLLAGRRVIELGAATELEVDQRLIEVLLQTARDEALPWMWRSICLQHAGLPLARLQALLEHHDPIACNALYAAVQAAGDALASAMPDCGEG
jgi:hypothetical protein